MARFSTTTNTTVSSKVNNASTIDSAANTPLKKQFVPSTIPIEHPVIDFFTKKDKGTIALDRSIFGAPLRTDILHRVVVWQLHRRRMSTPKQKTRAEVRGSGRKRHRQKGTGRARQGDGKAPHMRGGGRAFPKRPLDHRTQLNTKIRAFGLRVALSTKLAQGKLFIVDNMKIKNHKTRNLAIIPKEWGSCVLVEDNLSENLQKASNRMKFITALGGVHINVYDILKHRTLVLTKDAVESIQNRLKIQAQSPGIQKLIKVKEQVAYTKAINKPKWEQQMKERLENESKEEEEESAQQEGNEKLAESTK